MNETMHLLEQFYERFNANDLDGQVRLLDPDCLTVDPIETMRTAAAYRAYSERFRRALPDASLTVVSAICEGDNVSVEGRFRGTNTGPLTTPQGEVPPTGRTIDLPYVDIVRSEAGRIVEHHVYYDQMAFLAMLGLVEAPSAG